MSENTFHDFLLKHSHNVRKRDESDLPIYGAMVPYSEARNAMIEFSAQEKRSTAIAFQDWIGKNSFIQDADGFWYEHPEYAHEGIYGICVAIYTAALYDLFNSL